MAITYRLVKQNDNLNPDEEKQTGYFPRVVRGRTVGLRELCRLASVGTTLHAFEVEIAVNMVLDQIRSELLNSNHVCLDEFGTFSLTAESRRVERPEDIRAESIRVKRVVFKTSSVLMQGIKHATFVRAK